MIPTDFSLDLSNPGIALAVLGYFGFIFKDIPSQLWNLAKQKFSSSIQVSSMDEYIYSATIAWFLEKFPELHKHIQYIGWSTAESNMADGSYMFMMDKFTYAVLYKERNNGVHDRIVWNVSCQMVGKNRLKYLKEYKDMIAQRLPDKSDNLLIETLGRNGWDQTFYNKKKAFDDIFLKPEIKEKIIRVLNNFLKARPYYDEHGITYKMGILLSGAPGSGKTSFAKAIASYLGWKIIYMSADSKPDSTLTNCVIFFEDIDTIISENRQARVGIKRKDGYVPKFAELEAASANGTLHEYSTDANSKLTMHTLLNYLDGLMSPSNCIFVATTNYPENLDSALIRPGRFDYHFVIDHADKEIAKQLCDRFKVGYEILDDYEFPCSLSQIQNRIIQDKIDQ